MANDSWKRLVNQPTSITLSLSFAAWIKSEMPNGAILSHSDDYLEGTGHGLYLFNGKLRLHVVFRWTYIGLRVDTANPVKLHEWQNVLVTYDGKRKASGVRMYVNGQLQDTKVLFDELTWPMKTSRLFALEPAAGFDLMGTSPTFAFTMSL